MKKAIKIGLFGFGCVGQGLYDVLHNAPGFRAEIVRIVVKNRDKPRKLPADRFAYTPDAILDHPDINLVVELIDDPEAAYRLVKAALQRGKNVVTANKKMLALHLEELVDLQAQTGTALLYEAACCGSIPIIRTLEEYYNHELLHAFSGIFNGSSNYILTKIFEEGLPYAEALAQAQQLGFAESDPTLDVGGFDATYKLCILTAHAYGLFVQPDEVLRFGIAHLGADDVQYAREKGYRIKLVCQSHKLDDQRVALTVMPQFVRPDSLLYQIENEYNGVVVEAAFSEKQFFQGKGAGGHPTGSAVLSDIAACSYNYHYEYKKRSQRPENFHHSQAVELEVYISADREADLEDLPGLDVRERYMSATRHYLIAGVRYETLLALQPQLTARGLFVACTPTAPVALPVAASAAVARA